MGRSVWVAGLLTLALSGAAMPQDESSRVDALERRLEQQQEELRALQDELKRLREGGPGAAPEGGAQAAPPPPDEPAAESLQLRARFGEGVTLSAADDSSSLNIRARIQLRFTQEESDDHESESLFEVRRARLLLRGHALTKDFTYYIQLGFSNQDTEPDLRLPLRDAHVTYAGLRDLNVRVGQMKVPFNPQRVTSSSALQMVDRSIVNGELNLDRDVGLQVFSTDLFGLGKVLGYNLGVFGGDGRNRLANAGGVLFVARVQVTPFGTFDDTTEADISRSPEPRLALGLAAAHNSHSNRERSTHSGTVPSGEHVSFFHAAGDVHLKWHGFSLRSESIMRWADEKALRTPAGLVVPTRSAWGWFAQMGYMVTDQVEVVARHGEVRRLRRGSAVPFARETGAGLNWYLQGHDLKVQTDYFYLWGERLEDGDHQARLQLQLYF